MNPFDQAWALLKMARYQIGPTNMLDLGDISRLSGSGEYEEMKNQFGTEDHPFPVMGGAFYYGDEHVKTMMTPTEYMKIAYDTPREDLMYDANWEKGKEWNPNDDYLREMREQMELGRPYGMANFTVRRATDGNWMGQSQEGRHRMQSLIDMGHGDVEVPVTLTVNNRHPKRQYGGTQELREALHGRDLIQVPTMQQEEYTPGNTELHRIPIRIMEDQDFGEGTRRIV